MLRVTVVAVVAVSCLLIAFFIGPLSTWLPTKSETFRSSDPELVFFQSDPLGKPTEVDEYTAAFSPGNFLHLWANSPTEEFLYILGFGGDGQAQIHTGEVLRKVDWGWKITGPPPAETIILLISEQELSLEMLDGLTARINALRITPHLPDSTQLVWSNRQWKLLRGKLDVTETLGNLPWANSVLEVLNSIEGVTFSGRTLRVTQEREKAS